MSDDKCPTCKGPVEKHECGNRFHYDPSAVISVDCPDCKQELHAGTLIRSTAAEQPAHKFQIEIIALQQQLADKDVQINNLQNTCDYLASFNSESAKLAAANAVVEAADEWERCHYGPAGSLMPGQRITKQEMASRNLGNAIQEWRKLQGGE